MEPKTQKKLLKDPVRLTIELPFEVRQRLKAKAALEGLNLKEVVTKLIDNYLQDKHI